MAKRVSLSADLLDKLCDRLCGGEGIREICRDKAFPDAATIYRTMARDEEVASRIARARAAQQEAEADAMVEMADAATPADWQVVKLRIWARQWRAAKLAPKKYGERPAEEAENPDVVVEKLIASLHAAKAQV